MYIVSHTEKRVSILQIDFKRKSFYSKNFIIKLKAIKINKLTLNNIHIKEKLRSKVFSLNTLWTLNLSFNSPSKEGLIVVVRAGRMAWSQFLLLRKVFKQNLSLVLSLEPIEKFVVVGGGQGFSLTGGDTVLWKSSIPF